jgi:hypothetical protein
MAPKDNVGAASVPNAHWHDSKYAHVSEQYELEWTILRQPDVHTHTHTHRNIHGASIRNTTVHNVEHTTAGNIAQRKRFTDVCHSGDLAVVTFGSLQISITTESTY